VSEPDLFIGLISGTSRDGVDAVLVRFPDGHPDIREALCQPYPAPLADDLARLAGLHRRPHADEVAELDTALAGHFADTTQRLLRQAGVAASAVRAIGSHGQTVWHEPGGPDPVSIQLGDPGRIARLSGIVTVGDFRSADLAVGGQGAPLAPLLHRALFRPEAGRRVVLNLGGIANISILDDSGAVSGFDTGPANCLLDAWMRARRGEPFDAGGAWAGEGHADPGLLEAMRADPYFAKAPPKSTGTEYFNLAWIDAQPGVHRLAPADVQSTLAELTAVTVADAIAPAAPADVLVCGGGVHNAHLMSRIRAALPGVAVRSTAHAGLDPDWVEAVLFAWLARERLAERRQDTCSVTGARRPVLLGTIERP
jgi:anhydro-N-acetylmuramic acid kinase